MREQRGIKKIDLSPFLLLSVALLFSGCSERVEEREMLLLGTSVRIKVVERDRELAQRALDSAFSEIRRIDELLNFHNPKSRLSEINEKAYHSPLPLDDELFSLFNESLRYSVLTEGAFDITATSLGEAGGYKSILLDERKKTLYINNPKAKIDLGGIAKGYAVDRAMEVLASGGVENALIDAGGDIRTIGMPSYSRYWRIGIQDPTSEKKIISFLETNNIAIGTSGNYLREHIINTSGSPLSGRLRSVTILAASCMEADALATAVFVLGKASGQELIEKMDTVEGVLITTKGEVLLSSGIMRKKKGLCLRYSR